MIDSIADIFRHVLALNDSEVLELLISDDIYLGMAGALEYDTLLGQQAEYRSFISSAEHVKVIMTGLEYANPTGTITINITTNSHDHHCIH